MQNRQLFPFGLLVGLVLLVLLVLVRLAAAGLADFLDNVRVSKVHLLECKVELVLLAPVKVLLSGLVGADLEGHEGTSFERDHGLSTWHGLTDIVCFGISSSFSFQFILKPFRCLVGFLVKSSNVQFFFRIGRRRNPSGVSTRRFGSSTRFFWRCRR